MLVAECQQHNDVERQKSHMKVAIEKNLFRQKAPIHRPLE